ncbi:exported hypothetical protein [Tenacibaculum sediminilitoris]|uniref:hypothetical protein n=1 Tax=Tenacibaculum sediminilitoris TaxID=1820334 RepID=UPI003893BCA8
MKKVLFLLGFCLAINSFGQTSPTGQTWKLGYQNGCSEGTRTAYNSTSFTHSLNTVLSSSVSAEYKEGYREGMFKCSDKERSGTNIGDAITKFAKCHIFNDPKACKTVNVEVGSNDNEK